MVVARRCLHVARVNFFAIPNTHSLQAPGRTDLFEVVLPQDMYSLTIAVPHPGPSAHGLKAYKVTGTEQMLSGTLEVVHGSTVLATSMDLTGEIGVGDGVRIGNVDMTVANILPPRIEGGSQSSVVQGAPGSRYVLREIVCCARVTSWRLAIA